MCSALIGLLVLVRPLVLLAQTPAIPDVGQRVVVELQNGYRIEGILVEKDRRSAVLSLDSGEMRFALNRVRRFHVPDASPRVENPPAPSSRGLSISIGSDGGKPRRLLFSVPPTWKKHDDEEVLLSFSDPEGALRFQVQAPAETQSLWRITARIRRSYDESHRGFEVKQERFGNRWKSVRTWEIDFEYVEGEGEAEERYRERHLYLDFGRETKLFTFRTRASSFSALVGHFDAITTGMLLERAREARGEEEEDTTKPDAESPTASADRPIEELEEVLERAIGDAERSG